MNQPAPQLRIISVAMLVLGVLVEIFAVIRIAMQGEIGSSLAILVSGTMMITLGVLFLAVSSRR